MTAAQRRIEFEEEPHRYLVDGREVLSVTQVIKLAYGDLVWPWHNDFALERGRKVHRAMHLWIIGNLHIGSLSSYIGGFVAGGVRWLQESGFEIARAPDGRPATELRMYSELYDYTGTADLFGKWPGDERNSCVDFKTGDPGWATGVQTWAYAQQWQELTGEVVRHRVGLQLTEDGSYKTFHYRDTRNDQADFLAARRVVARRATIA